MNFIEKMKRFARLTAPKAGPLPDGPIHTALGLEDGVPTVVLVVDGRGRVFQIKEAVIDGGLIHQVVKGRSGLMSLMDYFGVEDLPDDVEDLPEDEA